MGEGEGLVEWAATSEEEDAGSQAGLGATAVSLGLGALVRRGSSSI